eukprot:TRINITY_DN758_c0_g1_i1.p1 TRINITY_DN758_c0_g1~~TRINITY_DN758_c0_g1_i1.p1  ORF type:complete len:335 (+),score=72.07 TRINITY_DN758_c0_g1_i1:173-1177(+)
MAIDLQMLLSRILKKGREYEQLCDTFEHLHELCNNIFQSNQTNARIFSTYYRVRFYGKVLGDMNGKQYIYKEKNIVRLVDLSERLKNQYGSKFGGENVHILPNKEPDESTFQDGHVYMQIAAVDAYIPHEELGFRPTPFERSHNINKFRFETPFTTTGKTHSDDMAEQCKRRTILTVSRSFPYVQKRLIVESKEETMLSPIETGTELMVNRIQALEVELNSPSPNTKTLQIVLQGSVLLQVNAGPMGIFNTFLGAKRDQFDKQHVKVLRDKMMEFVELCGEAVFLNSTLIGPDQKEFQARLEEGFEQLKANIQPYGSLIVFRPPLRCSTHPRSL